MGYDYRRHFGEIALTHDLTTLPRERSWQLTAPGRDPEPHRIVLYLGCNVLRTSHMIQTIAAIFDRLGLDYVAVGGPTYCCGIVHHRQGDTAAAGGMAAHTVELLKRFEPEEVVMWCPSCIYFYDEVQRADLPFPVRHAAEFLVAQLPAIQFTHRLDTRVALHYHVLSEPRQREGQAGRRLLEAVPGLQYVEIESDVRFGRSCTADVQSRIGADVWNGMLHRQIDQARSVGAGTLATIYHGCQRLICSFEGETGIAVEHYLSVFARGLGIEFEDKYKKYRLWQDPERTLADSAPCQRANNVDPARARELVEATFGPGTAVPGGAAS
jgi:Fe-S oxidoreductase